jgi:hypothetical protein
MRLEANVSSADYVQKYLLSIFSFSPLGNYEINTTVITI